ADETRSRVADETMASARKEQMHAYDEQVRLLHEAADAVRAGAWAQGLTNIAGAALTAGAHPQTVPGQIPTRAAQLDLDAGTGVREVAAKVGDLFGNAPAEDARAEAKRAEQRGADAGARADQAREQSRRAFDNADRTLVTLQSVLESKSQGQLAIIAN